MLTHGARGCYHLDMPPEKPVAEVLAAICAEEYERLGGTPKRWTDLSRREQARWMASMLEVIRVLGMLGVRVTRDGEQVVLEHPIERTPEPNPERQAMTRGFTGDTCIHCGSMQMQRAGACLVCHQCGATTSCG